MDDELTEFTEDTGLSAQEETKAYLVGVVNSSSSRDKGEEYLAELAALADTFGVEVVGQSVFVARKLDAATFLPSGRVDELLSQASQTGANLFIFDDEISPAQQRNLEKLCKVAVMDRTELILEIFAQRAHTKEAQLQVELAKTRYEFPRLKRLWSHFSRQRASGGYLKGEGEKQIEIDRRLLKKRLQRLNEQLKEVEKNRKVQWQQRRRSGLPTFAIVGYTNAGKSTLLKLLTGADVLVEDKLFATLDPTTRKFLLPNKQEILLSDTVGFIRKLPHHLVAAFRSTLEAVIEDDILLHLIDASHPCAEEHAETTNRLLKELGIDSNVGVITVLNKVDKLSDSSAILRLKMKYPKSVAISAHTKEGIDQLLEMMMQELANRRKSVRLKIPQAEYGLVSQLHKEGIVAFEEYEGNDVLMRVEIPIGLMPRFEVYIDELPPKIENTL